MLEATGWGLLAASSLVLGALIGVFGRPQPRRVGLVLGFGAGTLISAISFELTAEAYRLGGADALTFGLAAGALAFYFGDRLVSPRMPDPGHPRAIPEDDESGRSLLLGGPRRDLPVEPSRGDRRGGGHAALPGPASEDLRAVGRGRDRLRRGGRQMFPQANHQAGPASGLLTVLGFALAYLLSTL
jgi:hypothetical protein